MFERVAACWRTIDLCYAPCDPNERPQFRVDGRKAALSRMQAMSDLTIAFTHVTAAPMPASVTGSQRPAGL